MFTTLAGLVGSILPKVIASPCSLCTGGRFPNGHSTDGAAFPMR
jgi:hypothetical protein